MISEKPIEVENLGVLSLGSGGYALTVGILGMVFDCTPLLISDQKIRDAVWQE